MSIKTLGWGLIGTGLLMGMMTSPILYYVAILLIFLMVYNLFEESEKNESKNEKN
jgi:uncharacterized membrane protein